MLPAARGQLVAEQAPQGISSLDLHEGLDPAGDSHDGEEGPLAPVATVAVAQRVAEVAEDAPADEGAELLHGGELAHDQLDAVDLALLGLVEEPPVAVDDFQLAARAPERALQPSCERPSRPRELARLGVLKAVEQVVA